MHGDLSPPTGQARIVSLRLAAHRPPLMAGFWAEALACGMAELEDELVLMPLDQVPFDVRFERTTQEKVGQNTIHLDLTVTSSYEMHRLRDRLIEAGGTEIDIGQGDDARHLVLADPEGNEFCIIEPGNRFLAGCPRLGAVNADGTRQTGLFWSQVLGWPLIWDQDDETAIREPGGTGPIIQWSGAPLMPKHGKNRLHLDLAPGADSDQATELDRLIDLGACRLTPAQADSGPIVLADPDGNEFCLLPHLGPPRP